MPNMPMALNGHFDHYYKNIPVKLGLSLVFDELIGENIVKEKENFLEVWGLVRDMKSPQDFIDEEPALPSFKELPVEIQEKVVQLNGLLKIAREKFESAPDFDVNTPLERKVLYEEFDVAYDHFGIERRKLLAPFTQKY